MGNMKSIKPPTDVAVNYGSIRSKDFCEHKTVSLWNTLFLPNKPSLK